MQACESICQPPVKIGGAVADDVVGQKPAPEPQWGGRRRQALSDMAKPANNSVFVRPNLKAFLFGAVALLLVQHLISSGHSQPSAPRPLPVNGRELSEADVVELTRYANEHPSPEIYLRISRDYERRGDYRKALQYLRRAEKLSQSVDLGD